MQTQSGRLPDFFIVGAAKSATTSLYAYLRQHPDIFMPAWKEPMFFSYGETPLNTRLPAKNLYQYARMFAPAQPHQLMGEASTTYLYRHVESIRNIKKAYGAQAKDIRIIAILRNPVDRIFSHYCLSRLHGIENLPFERAIEPGSVERLAKRVNRDLFGIVADFDYFDMGLYSAQVAAYKEFFPHMKIIVYDDFKRDPQAAVSDVFRFLGVAPYPVDYARHFNIGGVPRIGFINTAINALRKAWASNAFPVRAAAHRLAFFFTGTNAGLCSAERRIGMFLKHVQFRNTKKAVMRPEMRRRLVDAYRSDIVRLQDIVGRDFSSWLS